VEEQFVRIIEILRAVGPGVVFLMTLVETAFFVGLIIPAEATVLVAAFLAAEGVFPIEYVLATTLLGALAGDQIGYALGRYGGRRFAARGGRLGRLWSRYEPRATAMFKRHAAVSVTLARFVSFVRTLMPWFAGMTGMPYGRFLGWDVLGVLGWGVASVAAGFVAGESWHVLASVLGTASAIIVGVLVLAGIVVGFRSRHAAGERAAEVDRAAAKPLDEARDDSILARAEGPDTGSLQETDRPAVDAVIEPAVDPSDVPR
jgi:membrane-associated protein